MRLIDEVIVVLFARLLVLLQNTLLYKFHIYAHACSPSQFVRTGTKHDEQTKLYQQHNCLIQN